MHYKTCEICGLKAGRVCDQKRTFMAKFPLDEDRCRKWVQVTGKEDLAYVPIEKLHEIKYICGKHFRPSDFKKKKTQLRRNAVPSLLITAKPLSDEILMGFPLHTFGSSKLIAKSEISNSSSEKKRLCSQPSPTVEAENSTCKKKRVCNPIPSTSTKITETVSTEISKRKSPCSTITHEPLIFNIEMEHDYCRSSVETPIPSTSTKITETVSTEISKRKSPCSTITHEPLIFNIEMEHDYCRSSVETPIPSTSTKITETVSTEISKRKSPCSTITHEPLIFNIEMEHDYCRSSVETPKSSTNNESVNPMTPRKKKLLKKIKENKLKIKNLQKKLGQIEKISSPVLKSIIESSLQNQNRKPKGKRWTKLSKSVALAIYKKSPKAYRYISQLIPMPSVRTLQVVLENMKMEPGIDISIMAHFKKKAENLNPKDKICVLLFDEIALKKRLIYNVATDKVDGFEDLGGQGGRSEKIANHALVLMLQGIHKKIKQPIAHYFVKGTISTEKLVIIIKATIRAVTEAGYKVLATVCDQGPTNVGAMSLLKNFSGEPVESHYFLLDGEKVFILYDVPHLFKSIRNNFLEAGTLKMNNQTAKWSHLVELEEKNQSTLHFTKITKSHINPKYRAKMRVKLAAQILSNTVAAILKLLAESVKNEQKSMEILETAHIVEDLDGLFDCTNGPASCKDIKKGIRQNVSKNSHHHQNWEEYKKKLMTLHFLKSDSQLRLRNVRCVKGYIITISSLQDIWKYVEQQNFKYLNLRQCNQDALENLFGIIRQHSPTNRNPTCHHFTSALKSSILTRLSTPVSRGSNCEQDENEILFDFHDIVFVKKDKKSTGVDHLKKSVDHSTLNTEFPVLHIPEQDVDYEIEEMEEIFKDFDKQPTVYVSGYLAKVLLNDVKCQECINAMKVDNPKPNSIYNYIALKEWWAEKTSLTYPTFQLCDAVDTATKQYDLEVKSQIYEKDICKYAITIMFAGTNLSWMCKEHHNKMAEQFLRRLSLLLIRNECRVKNTLFAELEDPLADKIKKGQQQGISK